MSGIVRDLESTKVVAVIRDLKMDVCVRLAEACRRGGIRLVEVPFDQARGPEGAEAAIRAIKLAFPDLHVGAGTVLTADQLARAIAAGAEFVVTPNTNPELIRKARAAGLITMPGAMTPTEVVAAHEAGADYVKIFPAQALGPQYVRDVLTPLRHVKLMAFAGVTVENAADFIKAGCVGVGVSGALANRAWIDAGEYDKVAEVARVLLEKVQTDGE